MRKHPTDWQLQQWIEDGAPPTGEVGEHVAWCRECARQAEAYAQLMRALIRPPRAILPEDFAERVAMLAPGRHRVSWLSQVATIGGIVAYAAVGLAVMIHFGAYALLLRALLPFRLALVGLIHSLEHFTLPEIPSLLPLLPAEAVVLLLAIVLLDRLLAKRLRTQ